MTTCRTCGASDTEDLGELPDVGSFAGVRLTALLTGGHLRKCRHCGFMFRDQILSDAEYTKLYVEGSTEVWDSEEDRADFKLVRRLVHDTPIDVLDVGCYTGQLLKGLPKSCVLHGVEPNTGAAEKATARGVHIVGSHWNDIRSEKKYDLITACDVIEHVEDPSAFLASLARRLRPGGRVVVTTANADAWLWKRMRSKFWYCHYPEHISFIGARWLSTMAAPAGLSILHIEQFRHSTIPGILGKLRACALFALYLASPCMYRGLARRALGVPVDMLPSPGQSLTKDHMMCEMRKLG